MARMKSSGRAKYASDFTQKDLLFGALLTSPHAHARVTSIDTSDAEKLPGVTAVRVIASAGTETHVGRAGSGRPWPPPPKKSPKTPRARSRWSTKCCRTWCAKTTWRKAGARAKSAGEQVKGDPDKAFQEADATVEGQYGIPVITHCCLEPHGKVIEWKGDQVNFWPSTQNVSGIGGDLSNNLKVPACEHSRRTCNTLAADSAASSPRTGGAWKPRGFRKASGGRPVKLFLDRATELMIAGNRPSGYANIKIARPRKTAPSRRGSRSPGRPAASVAEAVRPFRTSSTFPTSARITRRSRPTAAACVPGARRTISRPAI